MDWAGSDEIGDCTSEEECRGRRQRGDAGGPHGEGVRDVKIMSDGRQANADEAIDSTRREVDARELKGDKNPADDWRLVNRMLDQR